MSDTPRTNAAAVSSEFVRREMDYYAHKFVLADFARQLERELGVARKDVQALRDQIRHLVDDITHCPNPDHPTRRYIKPGAGLTFSNMVNATAALLPPPTSDPPE